jgi:hypothetical protein
MSDDERTEFGNECGIENDGDSDDNNEGERCRRCRRGEGEERLWVEEKSRAEEGSGSEGGIRGRIEWVRLAYSDLQRSVVNQAPLFATVFCSCI